MSIPDEENKEGNVVIMVAVYLVGPTMLKNIEANIQSSLNRGLYLFLVRQRQSEGEPLHWSLFLGNEDEPGTVLQVKGCVETMRYVPGKAVKIFSSGSFLDA